MRDDHMFENISDSQWHPDDEGRYWCMQGMAYLEGVKKAFSLEDATRCFSKAVEKHDVAAAYCLKTLYDRDMVALNADDVKVLDRILMNQNNVRFIEKEIVVEIETPISQIIKCSNRIENTLSMLFPEIKSKGPSEGVIWQLIEMAFKRGVINTDEKTILHKTRMLANKTRHGNEEEWATEEDRELIEQAYGIVEMIRRTQL